MFVDAGGCGCSATSPRRIRRGGRCSTSTSSSGSASPRRCSTGATSGRSAASSCCAASASTPSSTTPTTRSSGARGRMLAANQREQELKLELLVQIAGPRADRVSRRSTTTSTTSARRSGSSSPTASTAHTACLGFGHERIVLALLRTHGLDPDAWPAEVRDAALEDVTRDARRQPAAACRASTPRSYRPHALHASEPHLPRDQLLHRRHHRAAARLRLRAAGAVRPPRADGLRGRPVDVLQAAAGGPRAAVRHRHPRDAARTGRCRSRSPSSSSSGRTMIVELDSCYLPDTAATSYRSEHVKTSVAADAIDPERRAAALLPRRRACTSSTARTTAACSGSATFSADVLPPYTELVRFDAGPRLEGERCARPRCELAAPPPRAPPAQTIRSSASATQLDRRAARRCSRAASRTTTRTRSRPCGWSAPAFELAGSLRRVAARRAAAPRRPTPMRRSSTAARRSPSGSRAGASSIPSRCSSRSRRAGSEAIDALEEVVG